MLEQESGGHRIQRIPPTERRGRVHTSTVTVAVLPIAQVTAHRHLGPINADPNVTIEWFSGTGKGGQHRNKHQNSCRLKHAPTGIVVTSQCRERKNSLATAWAELERRVNELAEAEAHSQESAQRRSLVGSGMRADKIRTYRFQDDRVKDDVTGKTAKCSKVMAGNFNLLK